MIFGRRINIVSRLAKHVANGIDTKSCVINKCEPRANTDQECAQHMARHGANQKRKKNAGGDGPQYIEAVLMHQHSALLKVRNIFIIARVFPKNQPADMRVEETFLNAVRVTVCIHKTVVVAMLRSPTEGRLFKSRGAEKEDQEADQAACLKRSVCEKAVVTERDAGACRRQEKEKEKDFRKGDAKISDIKKGSDRPQKRRDDEKKQVDPNDLFDRN